MARKVGSVEIDIKGDSSGFRRELKLAEAGAKSSNSVIRNEFVRTGDEAEKVNKSIRSVGASLLAISVGAGLGLGASVNTLKNFGQAMSEVKAVSGATAAELAALTAEARRLGGTTRFSATEAATAIGLLARAGFTANEALVAVSGTLNLAQAGGLGLAESADIVSNVLGGFNLKATQTARIVDVLALAANASNSSVQELGEALVYAAPTASALGLGVEETVAALGKLADAGLKGGPGGRGFQSFATAFVGKRSEITEIIGEFNLAEEGLTNLVKRLTEAGITTDQVIDIFRVENLDVFTVLSKAAADGAKGLDPLTKKLKEAAGSAATTAKIMDDNLNGAILNMQSTLEELVLTFGEMFANGALIAAFTGLAQLFTVAAENADILAVAAVALAIRGLIPLATAAIPSVITSLKLMQLQIALVEGAAAKASVAMGFLGGPVTLLIVAAAAAFVALGRSVVTTDEAIAKFNGTLQKYVSARDQIKADNVELIRLNEQLKLSIEGQAAAAEETARIEIFSVSERIRKNKELKSVYESQLRADAALLKSSVARERDRLAGRGAFGGDSLGLVGTFGEDTVSEADFEAAITRKLASFERIQKAGGRLNATDNKVLRLIQSYRDGQASLEAVLDTLKELNKVSNDGLGGDFRDLLGTPIPKTKGPGTDDQSDEAAQQEAVFRTLQKTQELEIARLNGQTELVAKLEKELELAELIAQYKELGRTAAEAETLAAKYLEDRAKAEADAKERTAAAEEAAALAAARYDTFRMNKQESDNKKKEAEEAAEASREAFRQTFSEAVKDAISSGDVGTAIKEVFADNVARGMKDALDDLADAIYDLFSELFKSASGGSSGGGGLGGFLGGLLSGGIGGLFSLGGSGAGPASALGVSNMSGGGRNASPTMGQTVINIAGDASEKTIALMDQKLAQHRAALPSAIDSRVNDRIKRGAF
jgi:TP901 family phage tail tape measure protein